MKPASVRVLAKKDRASVHPKISRERAAKPVGRRGVSVHGKISRGMVNFYIDSATGRRPAHDVPVSVQVKALEAGLPETELTDLQTSLDLSAERIVSLVGLSKATFHRHKATGSSLNPLVSDRVVRFALLLSKAIKVFGTRDDANKWLSSPQFGLGGAVPLDYAKSEVGAREVENLLGRIEYGVYT